MITLTNLAKFHGKRALFENVSLTINRGEKIGLIGPNGSGKSTLFALILGESEPTSGKVHVPRSVRLGFLPQETRFSSERTVLQEVIEGDSLLIKLKEERGQLETTGQAGSQRYGEILHRLETLGFFEIEYRAKQVLAGLGFRQADFNRPIQQLSGGWQMRTLLAKLLICPYDILLLDEPTNYLDLNAALWFKDFLAGFKGTFLMISHDKAFLNEVTNYTLILEQGTLTRVHGNYEDYRKSREEQRQHLLKQSNEQGKRREQLQRFVDRFHAQPNKAAQVRAKKRFLEKMEEIVVPDDPRESIRDFRFPPTRASGQMVVSLKNISKAYGQVQVYRQFDFEIGKGEKAVLVGENGAGKSTLLKILAGVIDIDSGERKLGYNVGIGYFSQARLDVLNPENTVLQEAYAAADDRMTQTVIRTILSLFLFRGDDIEKKVKILSGGEKSRLILAKLLISPPNLLLLDEPTTHLDVDAVDALIKALGEYEGTLVFISHDIHFVRMMANVVYEVKPGQVRKFHGNFDYYLEKQKEEAFVEKRTPKVAPPPVPAGKIAGETQRQKERETRKAHNTAIVQAIKKLEARKTSLEAEKYVKQSLLDNPRVYHDKKKTSSHLYHIKSITDQILSIEQEIEERKKQFIK